MTVVNNAMALNSWKPDECELKQVLELLQESQSTDTQVQRQVHEKLEHLRTYPNFCNYLAYVLSDMIDQVWTSKPLADRPAIA
ncbi:unnamed protein product [Soboliphyme baturini]|uniref:Importin N-terminal domain-containing protein n=1 Tax=Soboliphyme baturini TaxID=241478 RepID=A0A183IW88_9BILA|nr:unnamed protein product [Soboliphyme baturini]